MKPIKTLLRPLLHYLEALRLVEDNDIEVDLQKFLFNFYELMKYYRMSVNFNRTMDFEMMYYL